MPLRALCWCAGPGCLDATCGPGRQPVVRALASGTASMLRKENCLRTFEGVQRTTSALCCSAVLCSLCRSVQAKVCASAGKWPEMQHVCENRRLILKVPVEGPVAGSRW